MKCDWKQAMNHVASGRNGVIDNFQRFSSFSSETWTVTVTFILVN